MMTARRLVLLLAVLVVLPLGSATRAQDGHQNAKTPSQALLANWNDIGGRIVAMAQDWPEDKYSYQPNAQVRTFQQVLLHVAGSNYGLVNHVAGNKMGDERNDPAIGDYKTKDQTVAFLKKSVADGAAEIQKEGDSGVLTHLDYWTGYTEHMGEHYGQLVVYYRNNGVVPPESRPKK